MDEKGKGGVMERRGKRGELVRRKGMEVCKYR
jgi:hypothetical protein